MGRMAMILVTVTLAAAGCAGGNEPAARDASRTVDIEMRDTAFRPDAVQVEAGETVRFRFKNTGKVAHEAFVGDRAEQRDHEEAMREMEDGHGHGDMEGIRVEPGDSGTLVHRFAESGTVEIGCHEPGHYAAGMVVEVRIR